MVIYSFTELLNFQLKNLSFGYSFACRRFFYILKNEFNLKFKNC